MATRLRGPNGRFVGAGQAVSTRTTIRIEVDARRATSALNAFAAQGFADLMETLGTLVEGQTKRRIVAEKTSPDGAAWPSLKAATIARKSSKSILVDTGRLLGSISHTSSGSSATVGTNVAYAGFLQSGTRKMPARPFLGISEANMSEIRSAVDAWVAGAF